MENAAGAFQKLIAAGHAMVGAWEDPSTTILADVIFGMAAKSLGLGGPGHFRILFLEIFLAAFASHKLPSSKQDECAPRFNSKFRGCGRAMRLYGYILSVRYGCVRVNAREREWCFTLYNSRCFCCPRSSEHPTAVCAASGMQESETTTMLAATTIFVAAIQESLA